MNKKISIVLILFLFCSSVYAYDYEKTVDLQDFPYKEQWNTNISISTANTTVNISSSSNWLSHKTQLFFDTPTAYNLIVNISLANSISVGEYEEIVTLETNYGTSAAYTFFFNITELTSNPNYSELTVEVRDKYTDKLLEHVEIELYLNDSLMHELKTNNKGKVIFDELKPTTCYDYICELDYYFNDEGQICTDEEEDLNVFMNPQEINYEDMTDEKQLEIAYDILQKLANKSVEEDKTNENKIIIEPKIIQTIPYSQGMWSMMLKCDTDYITELEEKYDTCDIDKHNLHRSNKRLEEDFDNLTATYERDTKGHVHVFWAILPFIGIIVVFLLKKLDTRLRNSCRG